MRRIKIGQIGTGHFHAEGKMEAVRKFPDVFEVVGIAEPDPANLKKYAGRKTYEGLTWMSPGELLSVKDLDAVLVETNEWDLVSVARQCIDAGVHIHLDKPAGEDLDEYAAMLREARRKSRIVQLGYMYRYNPAIQYCKKAVESGRLGEIFGIDAVMNTEHTREVREYLGRFRGGTMYIFGCHLIDLILSMQGMPDNIVPFQDKTMLDGVDVYDYGFAVFEYARGTSTVKTTSVEVKGYVRRQLVVSGSRGTIEIKPLEGPTAATLAVPDRGHGHVSYMHDHHARLQTIDLPALTGRYDDQMLDFAAMIRGERENPYTYEHELAVQAATLRASGFDIDLKKWSRL